MITWIKRRGFSLIETIVSLNIMAVIGTGVMNIVPSMYSAQTDFKSQTTAQMAVINVWQSLVNTDYGSVGNQARGQIDDINKLDSQVDVVEDTVAHIKTVTIQIFPTNSTTPLLTVKQKKHSPHHQ